MSNRIIEKVERLENSKEFELILNQYYSELCFSIFNGISIKDYLDRIVHLIYNNLDLIKKVPSEDRYMVFNTIKLAKTIDDKMALEVQAKNSYQKLEEEYKNSR